MTSRRRNPSRACKASSAARVSTVAAHSGSSEEWQESDPEEVQKNTKSSKSGKRASIESDDSSFSAQPGDEENVPEEEFESEEQEPSSEEVSEEEPAVQTKKRRKPAGNGSKGVPKPSKSKITKKTREPTSQDTTQPGSEALSEKQEELLTRIFGVFDANQNGRITLTDILRVADDHGVVLSTDEARDMLRFWDTSGTSTISRKSFSDLALDCKFMTPVSAKR